MTSLGKKQLTEDNHGASKGQQPSRTYSGCAKTTGIKPALSQAFSKLLRFRGRRILAREKSNI